MLRYITRELELILPLLIDQNILLKTIQIVLLPRMRFILWHTTMTKLMPINLQQIREKF